MARKLDFLAEPFKKKMLVLTFQTEANVAWKENMLWRKNETCVW